MNPDFTQMVNEMVKPMIMLIMFIVTCLSIAIAIQFGKDLIKIEKKLGPEAFNWILNNKRKETQNESNLIYWRESFQNWRRKAINWKFWKISSGIVWTIPRRILERASLL